MASPKFIKLEPPKTCCVHQGFYHLLGSKSIGRHQLTLGRPISSPSQKYTTLCGIHKTGKTGTGEVITYYDAKVLFTSVPVDPSIQIVQQKLSQNPTLPQRANMSIQQIIKLLEFCLKNTYFLLQGKYYEQVLGAAMGSPISPLIVNLFMEEFEVKALSTAPTLHLWLRFVDDTFVVQKAEHSQ